MAIENDADKIDKDFFISSVVFAIYNVIITEHPVAVKSFVMTLTQKVAVYNVITNDYNN